MDEYDSCNCDHCGESLVQLGGDWLCPDCDDVGGDSFTLDGEGEHDFAL